MIHARIIITQIVSAMESLSHPENDEISDFYSKDLFLGPIFLTKCLQLSFLEQADTVSKNKTGR